MKSVLSLDETPSALERSISAASKLNLFIYLFDFSQLPWQPKMLKMTNFGFVMITLNIFQTILIIDMIKQQHQQ